MGCQPQISGRLDLDRNTAGAAQATLHLVRGNVPQKLSVMANQLDAEAIREAARQLLPQLAREIEERRLRLDGILAASDATAEADDCLPAAEGELADAKREYLARIAAIESRLTSLGLETHEPRVAIDELQSRLIERLNREAERLRSAYLTENVLPRSEIVFTQSVGTPDRLCWSVENRGHLTLLSAELQILHDGNAVAPEVAQMVWGLARTHDRFSFVTRDHNGERVYGLPSGQRFEQCLYAITKIPPDKTAATLAHHGIVRYRPSRQGVWSVRLGDVEVTNSPARRATDSTGRWEFDTRPLYQVFARELEETRAATEEAQLIRELGTSPVVRRLRAAEQSLLACHRVVELQQEIVMRERMVRAIQDGATDRQVVQGRLRPIAAAYKRAPERLEASVRKAKAVVNAERLATQFVSAGESYVFESVPPGEYTLGGILPAAGGTGMVWLIPVHVEGSVEQDLGEKNALAGSFGRVLEEILLAPRT